MKRLASNIEQLVLALDHISQADANNARFALMLVDNVVEITLHHFAKHTHAAHKARHRYEDTDAALDPVLVDAIGRYFEPKVKFARRSGLLSEDVAASVVTSTRSETIFITLVCSTRQCFPLCLNSTSISRAICFWPVHPGAIPTARK